MEALRFYDDPRYVARQFYIAASAAAPWLYITRQLGLVINAVGAGGTSKSTTLRAAASVWGDPANFIQSGLSHSHTRRGLRGPLVDFTLRADLRPGHESVCAHGCRDDRQIDEVPLRKMKIH